MLFTGDAVYRRPSANPASPGADAPGCLSPPLPDHSVRPRELAPEGAACGTLPFDFGGEVGWGAP